MTEDKNESVAEDTVDSMIDAAQSTTRFAMKAIGNATEATGELPIDTTRRVVRRVMKGSKNEQNQ